MVPIEPPIAGLFREQSGALVAQLTARFGARYLDDVEDAVQDALLAAMRCWSLGTVPQNPAAWLQRSARNALIDRLRRRRFDSDELPNDLATPDAQTHADTLDSGRLGLLFLCAAPALNSASRLAVMLKLACGLGTAEIAGVLLMPESAILQRVVRAKAAIRELGVGNMAPVTATELAARVPLVAQSIYLMFSCGYFSARAAAWMQPEVCGDALRLARELADEPRTRSPETQALAALLCFSASRLPARGQSEGPPVPLSAQDRSLWLRSLIDEGFRRFEASIGGSSLSRYHVECAIAACHARAASFDSTDWRELLSHYDLLCREYPSPAGTLNRLVVMARIHGSEPALASATTDASLRSIEHTTTYLATMAQLHEDLGQLDQAIEQYDAAAASAGGEPLAHALRERARSLRAQRRDSVSSNSS